MCCLRAVKTAGRIIEELSKIIGLAGAPIDPEPNLILIYRGCPVNENPDACDADFVP